MKKRILLLTIMAIVAMISMPLTMGQTAVPPAAGNGTSSMPYQIETLGNLYWIASNTGQWSAHYRQTANIEAGGTSGWFPTGGDDYQGWTPIGNSTQSFTGVYDGEGFSIDGLYLNRPDDDYGGLFGVVEGGAIRNLGIDGADIYSKGYAGIMAGSVKESEITNCSVVGNITASGNSVGGLAGHLYYANLTMIRSDANVSGANFTGGVAGSAFRSTITKSFSASVVNGGYSSGGFVGFLDRGEVANSYFRGSMNGPSTAGGFVGLNQGGTITHCYSAADILGVTRGFAGNNTLDGEVLASFWDSDLAGSVTSAAGTPLTTDEMTLFVTYLNNGWDFQYASVSGDDDFWGIDESRAVNGGYPFLSWQQLTHVILNPTPFTLSVTVGGKSNVTANGIMIDPGSMPVTAYGFVWNTTGSAVYGEDNSYNLGEWDYESPFIASIGTLEPMTRYYIRSFAVSTHGVRYGIDLTFTTWPTNPVPPAGEGTGAISYQIESFENLLWLSMTNEAWDKYFIQTADIDASGSPFLDNGGGWSPIGNSSDHFTGSYDGGSHAIDGLFIGEERIGEAGLFGYISDAHIANLAVTDASTESGSPAGLLAGRADNSTIINSYTTGSVNSGTYSSYLGGLVGYVANTEINGCFSTADVVGGSRVGGLAGFTGTGTVVSNSYALGSSSGFQYVGGLIGWAASTSVVNSYSAGGVVATATYNKYGGGLIGRNGGSEFTASFWDIGTSGYTSSSGGTGKTTDLVKSFPTFLDAGWDFAGVSISGDDDIWSIYETGHYNFGYPFHSYMAYPLHIIPYTVTGVADPVTASSVVISGDMIFEGVPAATGHGFVWNSTGGAVVGIDGHIDLGPSGASGQFSALIEGLEANTKYHIRTWGVGDAGIYRYGEEVLFRTHPFDPVLPAGSGTADDPYLIETLANLYWLSVSDTAWNRYFRQTADIDAGESVMWNDGGGWMPLGSYGTPFSGSYDGAGYAISGIFITVDEERVGEDDFYGGLFGYLHGASISSVVVHNITVQGGNYSGGLAGYAKETTIRGSYVTGTITPWSSGGGIAGMAENSVIDQCFAIVQVSATWGSGAGAIAGRTESSVVINSYAAGSITAGSFVGGVVGQQSGASQMVNSYSKAAVTASHYEGGLVGHNGAGSSVVNSFWDTETSGTDISAGGDGAVGLSSADMKRAITFITAGWDFMGETITGDENIWGIDESGVVNEGYPFLAWQGYETVIGYPLVVTQAATYIGMTAATLNGVVERGPVAEISDHGFIVINQGDTTAIALGALVSTSYFQAEATGLSGGISYRAAAWVLSDSDTIYGADITFMTPPFDITVTPPVGDGTAGDPYKISSLADLYWMAVTDTAWKSHFLQTASIDASETAAWYQMKGWNPVGTTEYPFRGHYDGDGHTITGLSLNRPELSAAGLFGKITGASHIKNLRLEGIDITGGDNAGGIAGVTDSLAVIEGSAVTGAVRGHDYVGGIAGYTGMSTIINSYSEGVVEGNDIVGGITGIAYYSTITSSYSLAGVTGSSMAGGFVGVNSVSHIENCYARGSVSGDNNIAGFVGLQAFMGTIANCYSTGVVSGSGDNISGFANSTGGTTTRSYWDREASHITVSQTGEGRSSEEMKYPAATNAYLDWNFDAVWVFAEGLNDGYPLLAVTLNLPEVTTSAVTAITSTSALAGGDVVSDGGMEVTARGVVWSIEEQPTLESHTGVTEDFTAAGSFVSELTALIPATTYYLRAYATNAHGTTYGQQRTFNTDIAILTLEGSFSVFNKSYDGTRAATVSLFDITLQGFIEGYKSVSLTGLTIEFGDSDASSERKAVYITTAALTGSDASLYTLSLEGAPQTQAMIVHRQLTIAGSFTVFDKDYDGTTATVIDDNSLTLAGVITTDDVTLASVTAEFTESEPGSDITVVITGATLAGGQSHNYTLTLGGSPVTSASIATPTATGRLAAREVVLYPNPFAERIYLSNAELAERLIVTSLMGRRYIDTNIDGDGYVETSLPGGIYFVQVIFRDGSQAIVTMIKTESSEGTRTLLLP